MIPNLCIEVQTSPENRPSVPEWFAEVVIMVHHLTKEGVLDAFAHQVRLKRGRFGSYEPIDFLVLLLGYSLSGERTLAETTSPMTGSSAKLTLLVNPIVWQRFKLVFMHKERSRYG